MKFFRSLRRALAALATTGLVAFAPAAPSNAKLPRPRYAFRGYGVEQGLLNLAIQCLAQDPVGFLWVGTEEGLFRYDGERFRRYGLEEGLPSTYIEQIAIAPDGSLWVGTQGGLAHQRGDKFITVTPASGLPASWTRDLAIDRQGSVWVGIDQGLFRSSRDGSFTAVPGWPGGECTAVATGQGGDIYAAGHQGLSYRTAKGQWVTWGKAEGLDEDRLDTVILDPKGALWARSNFHLWVREPGATRFQPRDQGLSRGVTKGRMMLDSKGVIWVPTNLGLAQWDQGATRWNIMDTSNGLPSNLVGAAFEDREGSVWAGASGLFRWLGRGLWSSYAQREGLPSDVIWCIFRDHLGQLWVGTDQGLSRATAEGWTTIPESRGHAIRRASETSDGKIWMGGSPLEMLLYDPRSGRVDRFGSAAGLRGKRLMSVLVDRSDQLWVAADAGGLMKAVKAPQSPGGWRFEPVDLPNGTPTEDIRSLVLDKEGRLWAAGTNGLAYLEGGRWRRFTTRDGLRRNYVSYLYAPKSGGIRFTYFEPLGLSRAQLEGGALQITEHLDTAQGLQPGKVYLIGEDAHGRLWIGSGHGVDVVEPGGVRHLGQADGLPGEDCDANAFYADDNGDVWIGTSSGLAHFNGAATADTAPEPNPVLLSVRLGPLEVSLPAPSDLKVPHRDGTLEVRFAGLSFLNEAQVHYQVRLLQLEPEWRPTDVREARYPALRPGKYIFEIRARQGDGPWSKAASLSFQVLPAWWQTWWFRILVVLAGGGLVALLVRWRIAALHRHNQELARLVAERTEQLSGTNLALADANAALSTANQTLEERSVTDPLTGLKNRRFLLDHLGDDVALVNRHYQSLKRGQQDRIPKNIDLLFLMVDIDHFKYINDHYGHAAGDRVLEQIRDILLDASRESDTPVRWGGEEFLMIGRYMDRDFAAVFAERIRAKVAEHVFDLGDGKTIQRTCSIGFACYPFLTSDPDHLNWEEVVNVADHCLYAAKGSGRNAWVGVQITQKASPEDLAPRLREGLGALVAEGYLKVITSLEEGTPLKWGE